MLKGHIYLWGAILILVSASGIGAANFCENNIYGSFAPNSITSGDYDNDGDIDLAMALSYNHIGRYVAIRFNNGSGQLDSTVSYDIEVAPRKIISADIDGDNDLDLVVTFYPEEIPSGVRVLFNDGNGNFTIGAVNAAGDRPYQIRAGDLDGDTDLDLAIANRGTNYISLLFNDGTGGFSAPVSLTVGSDVQDVCIADFDHDHDSDLAVANYGSPGFSVLINSGSGSFAPAVDYPMTYTPVAIRATDFDTNGDPDLIVFCPYSGAVLAIYYTGNGDGTFTPLPSPPQTVAVRYYTGAILSDFTNDGLDDMAVVTAQPEIVGMIWVFHNSGGGVFEAYFADGLPDMGHSVGAADLDGDGDLDLIGAYLLGFVTYFNRLIYPCGDANCDETVSVGDVVYLIAYIFKDGPEPSPMGAGDANCDGDVNVADAVYMIAYIFKDGPAPCCP